MGRITAVEAKELTVLVEGIVDSHLQMTVALLADPKDEAKCTETKDKFVASALLFNAALQRLVNGGK